MCRLPLVLGDLTQEKLIPVNPNRELRAAQLRHEHPISLDIGITPAHL